MWMVFSHNSLCRRALEAFLAFFYLSGGYTSFKHSSIHELAYWYRLSVALSNLSSICLIRLMINIDQVVPVLYLISLNFGIDTYIAKAQ